MSLNLPGFEIIDTKYAGEDKCIILQTTEPPASCPKCRDMFPLFYGHGARWQFFHDTPSEGKRVALKIHRKRYKCRSCGGTFEEPLSCMHPEHTMTRRLAEYITRECYRDKFTDVARRTGPTEKTVRNVFRDHVEMLRSKYHFETPEILGIDEIHIRTPRAVITNIKDRTIIDMLPTRDRASVTEFLLKMDRKAVKIVTIDMWPAYREAAYTAFPQAQVIVDRFHAQKIANETMTKVRIVAVNDLPKADRKRIKNAKYIFQARNFNLTEYQQDCLLEMIDVCPVLGHAYKAKEQFMDIWEATDRQSAELLYAEWKNSVHPDAVKFFKPMMTSFKNWGREIFNWWDSRYTNAFTESVNGKIRELHRAGRGYSFEVLRARIISKVSLHHVKAIPPKFDKNAFQRTISTTQYANYGIDISKLLALQNLDDD